MRVALFALLLIFSFEGYAQQLRNATIVAVVPFGNQMYCILNEDGTNDYYKTSPHSNSILVANKAVQIDDVITTIDLVEVTDADISIPLFATKIQQNGQGNLFPPAHRMPVLRNEILFFESEEHIQEFYQLVDVYLYEGPSQSAVEVKLNKLENEFPGFTSFSDHLENKYQISKGGFTEKEVDEIERADIINEIIHKSLFNEHRLIGVGNEIYYYHTSNFTLVINENVPNGVQILEAIQTKQDAGNYDIFSDPLLTELYKDEDTKFISSHYETTDTKGYTQVNPQLGYQTTIHPWDEVGCDRYTKNLRISFLDQIEIGVGATEYTIDGTFVINWGDGAPVQTVLNYEGEAVTHVYPIGVSQIYQATTSFTFVNTNGDLTTVLDGYNAPQSGDIAFNTEDACSRDAAEAWDQKIVGSWMLRSKIWAYDNWLGHHVGSYTHAWKNEGGWGLKRATIAAFIDGNFRDGNDCTFKENQAGDRHHNNQKTVQKSKTKVWGFYSLSNGDVTSYHTFHKGGTGIGLSMTLNVCP